MTSLRQFALPAAVTVALLVTVTVVSGTSMLVTAVALTGLEVLLSFDNAAVNAKLLRSLSARSQWFFLTVGILVAVFVVRFALPIAIVSATAPMAPGTVVDLALHQPAVYAAHLTHDRPVVGAFGGMFLFMIVAGFFFDPEKDEHWLGPVERRMAWLGNRENIAGALALVISLIVTATIHGDAKEKLTILIACCVGIGAHMLLDVFGGEEPAPTQLLVGGAAVVMLLRLEVLDASFSFDGVIGAFAFTNDVVIIAACLGAGAMWVRSFTVYLLRTGVLDAPSARYLEHGAHWAIASLVAIMLTMTYGVNVPEWVPAGAGLLIVGAAIFSSIRGSVVVTSELDSGETDAEALRGRSPQNTY